MKAKSLRNNGDSFFMKVKEYKIKQILIKYSSKSIAVYNIKVKSNL